MEPVAGIEPLGEQFRRGGAGLCVHEFKEQFLQGVSLVKLFGEIEHHVHSGSIFVIQSASSSGQQLSGAFTYENLLKPGMSIRLGGEKGIIKSVFELEDGIVNIICEMENQYIPLPDGEYEAEVVVEATTPISFLWQ